MPSLRASRWRALLASNHAGQPQRRRRWRSIRPLGTALAGLGVVAAAGAVVFTGTMILATGAPQRPFPPVVRSTITTIPAAPAPATPPLPAVALARTRAFTPSAPLRVLILGDSVMYDASPGLAAALEATGVVHVDTRAVFGFGLSRMSYDWRTQWADFVVTLHPDLVITMFGGWDGPVALTRGLDWYDGLVTSAVALLHSGGASVLFLQYPRTHPWEIPQLPSLDPRAIEVGRRVVNRAFADEAQRHPGTVAYLPTDQLLAPDGRYADLLPDLNGQTMRVRKRDGVHVCPAGSALIAKLVIDSLAAPLGLPIPNPAWQFASWRADRRFDDPHGFCAG